MRASRASRFAVWAPNARRVSVVGDFNDWDGRRIRCACGTTAASGRCSCPGCGPGTLYKYEIARPRRRPAAAEGRPARRQAEHPPGTASIVAAPSRHVWQDGAWMAERWRAQRPRGADLDLRGASRLVAPRLRGRRPLSDLSRAGRAAGALRRRLGFTHIELLPVTEYPFDGSWGYQPIGLFAPTRRFGTPDEFRALRRALPPRRASASSLDWVPGHFPTDAHGLGRFDGTALYEHADPRQGFHRDWNTLIYNYGRREVANFLLVERAVLARELPHRRAARRCGRLDAVPRLQPQGGRVDPERYGGRENLEAIAFLRAHERAGVSATHRAR